MFGMVLKYRECAEVHAKSELAIVMTFYKARTPSSGLYNMELFQAQIQIYRFTEGISRERGGMLQLVGHEVTGALNGMNKQTR